MPCAGVLCGAAASGKFTWTPEHVAQSLVCMTMSGPFLTGYTQTINDYYDREIDAINEPDRPIPSGVKAALSAWQRMRSPLWWAHAAIGCLHHSACSASTPTQVHGIIESHEIIHYESAHLSVCGKLHSCKVTRISERCGAVQGQSQRQRWSSNSWRCWQQDWAQPLPWTNGLAMRRPRCSTWRSLARSSRISTQRRP